MALRLPKLEVKIGKIELLKTFTVSLAFLSWHAMKTVLGSLIIPGLVFVLIVVFFGRFFCGC